MRIRAMSSSSPISGTLGLFLATQRYPRHLVGVALHEAGHAAVAHSAGAAVDRVWINRTGAGRTAVVWPPDATVVRRLAFVLGGAVAARELLPGCDDPSIYRGDATALTEMLNRAGLFGHARQKAIDEARGIALTAIVGRHSCLVAIVDALLTSPSNSLNAAELRRLFLRS